MQRRPKINPLLAELVAAHRNARGEDLAQALGACGLHQHGGPIFGVEFVAYDAHHYAPEPGGTPAIVLPHFEDGRLLDLVAVGLRSRGCRTREGICTVLGGEWLDHARDYDEAVRIYSDPLAWLLDGRKGAVIVDWRAARHVLADAPALECDQATADRIDKAMRRPVHMPRLVLSHQKKMGQQVAPSASGSAPTDKADDPAETKAREEWAAKTAEHKIRKAATETHPYLDSIGFPKLRGLVHEGLLLVPMRLDGRTVSLQEIAADGSARFLPGGKITGAAFTMGTGRDEVLCADYAAALSIRAALDGLCLPARVSCCFSADNMATIAQRRRHAVIFTGDANGLHRGEGLPTLQRILLELLQGGHAAPLDRQRAAR